MKRMVYGMVLALLLGLVSAGGAGVAQAAPVSVRDGKTVCDKFGSTPVAGGRYEVQNDAWGADTRQCVTAFDVGFTVQADHHKSSGPASYPSIVFGCNYGNCTKGSPFPRPISDLGDVRSSWRVEVPKTGDYNAAYDVWFDPTPRRTGAPTGLEMMIWLTHTDRVNPIGKQTGEVTLAGTTWEVWRGDNGVPVVSYVRKQPTLEVTNLPIGEFTAEAQRRGLLTPTSYLTSVQAGFEPWIGGTGLATRSFSVTRNGA